MNDIEKAIHELEELKISNNRISKIALWHDENGWSCGIEVLDKYEYRWEMEDELVDAIHGCVQKFKNGG